MAKNKKRRRQHEEGEEGAPEDPDGEIEGFLFEGELFLRDQTGLVYASERDMRGALVKVGKWDSQTTSIVRAPKVAKARTVPGDQPEPSEPHPAPQPLNFFAVEEDHCETAPESYAHIVGVLQLIARKLCMRPEALRIYDPYYCNGAVVRHLAALGFPNVYNCNEDFYLMQAALA